MANSGVTVAPRAQNGRARKIDTKDIVWTNGLATLTRSGGLLLSPHYGQQKAWDSTERFILVTAGTQSGKALALDTPIPTPSGWRTIGDLTVGDYVYGRDGEPARVSYISPIYTNHDVYRLKFEDGEEILADAEHLWYARVGQGRWAVRRTIDIVSLFERRKSIFVPVANGIDGARVDEWDSERLYAAGVVFGGYDERAKVIRYLSPQTADGIVSRHKKFFAHTDDGNKRHLRCLEEGCFQDILSNLHRLALASKEQRREFVRGVCDAAGEVAGVRVRVWLKSELDAEAFQSILAMSGIKAVQTADGVAFRPLWQPFTHNKYWAEQCGPIILGARGHERMPRALRKKLIKIDKLEDSVPVRCITVENGDSTYLAGRFATVTHNTSFGPWWLWREILARGGGDYLAVTTNYDLYKLKILPEMLRVFTEILKIGKWWPGERVIELRDPETGKFWAKRSADPMWGRILLRSAAAPESLESATAKGAWLDEVGQDSWDVTTWEAILRRLSLHRGRVLMTTTVYNSGWLKTEVFDRAMAGEPGYVAISFPSIANPTFPRDEFERAKRTMPRWRFEMFYLGKFTKPAGLIYGDFDRDTMVIPRDSLKLSPHWRYLVGIDFGGANTAAVFMALDDSVTPSRWIVFDEYWYGGVSTDVHVYNVRDKLGDFYDVQYVGGSPGETQYRMDWQANGLPVEQPPISEIEVGISMVIRLIRERRLYVTDNCKGLLHELASYRRKLAPDGVTPLDEIDSKRNFHRLDALRYAATLIGNEEVSGEIFLY